MSHGVSCAGSDVLSALYEAKMGKRIDAMELSTCQIGARSPAAGLDSR